MLNAMCQMPPCRNADVRSRQYSPSATPYDHIAPVSKNVPVVSPDAKVTMNAATLMPIRIIDTMPSRPGIAPPAIVRGSRTDLAPSAMHDGHWNPTAASFMHSGQISRSQRWHEM